MSAFFHRLVQFVLLLGVLAATAALSAVVAGRIVDQRLAALRPGEAAASPTTGSTASDSTEVLDFLAACGMQADELQRFLSEVEQRERLPTYPAHLTFHDVRGNCLVNRPVDLTWNGGADRVVVGQSGVLRIMLRKELLANLKLRVPAGFNVVGQHTIPLGTAFRPYPQVAAPNHGNFVVDDFATAMTMWRALAKQRAAGIGLTSQGWREQIARTRCERRLPAPTPESTVDAAEIVRRRRDSVVVVGHLMPNGEVVHAAGVIVDPQGIVATAYHVIDKEQAVARGVMTADGRTFPIEEILAADRAADVALVRVAGDRLVAAPLSDGDPEGSPLVILSHPGGEFYSATQGHLRRYHASLLYGTAVLQMAVTADFVDGASGGPVFNLRGELAGLVSFRRSSGVGELSHLATPVAALRALTAEPARAAKL